MLTGGHDDRHHLVADAQVGDGVGPDLVDHASHVHAGDVRRLVLFQLVVAGADTRERVGRVDRRRVNRQAHLARRGVTVRQLEDP